MSDKPTPEQAEQNILAVSGQEFIATIRNTRTKTIEQFKKLDLSSRLLTPAKLEALTLIPPPDTYVFTEQQLILMMHLMFTQGYAECMKNNTPVQ